MASKRQVVIISDSSDETLPTKRARTSKVANERRQLPAPALAMQQEKRGSKQSTLKFSSSQEERKGALDFSTSQEHQVAISPGPRPPVRRNATGNELWVEKYAPQFEEDLIIHKKKVLALKNFLHSQCTGTPPPARLMVITGPTGCGKSTTLQVLSAAMGFRIMEWEAPVPMLWNEHIYQADGYQQYVSKLDAFESFVSRAKLAPLAFAQTSYAECMTQQLGGADASAESRKLILVDDLPHAAGHEHRRRLADALATLASTAQGPVIVMLTEAQNERTSSGTIATASQDLHTDLGRILDAAGALHLSFNPITTLNTMKVLNRVAEAEALAIQPEQVRSIAEASGGDLYNAIETLQIFGCGKADPALLAKKSKKGRAKVKQKASSKIATRAIAKEPDSAIDALGRDMSLGIFHALGKILYNKRLEPGAEPTTSQVSRFIRLSILDPMYTGNEAVLAGRFERASMSFDPEDVLMASGMEPSSVMAFLHENFTDFVDDEAIEDLAAAFTYLSDADWLLSHRWASTSDVSLDGVAAGSTYQDAMGGSLAVRGFLWSNAHPSHKRWLPLKGPLWFTVQRGIKANVQQLQRLSSADSAQLGGGRGSAKALAVGWLPFLRVMASCPCSNHASQLLPLKWTRIWDGKLQADDSQKACQSLHRLSEQLEDMPFSDDSVEDADED